MPHQRSSPVIISVLGCLQMYGALGRKQRGFRRTWPTIQNFSPRVGIATSTHINGLCFAKRLNTALHRKEIVITSSSKKATPRKETPLAYYFGIDIDDYDDRDTIDNYRIVFWFDN